MELGPSRRDSGRSSGQEIPPPPFLEHKGALLCSRQPIIGPYLIGSHVI
jgi:hypothetical protein